MNANELREISSQALEIAAKDKMNNEDLQNIFNKAMEASRSGKSHVSFPMEPDRAAELLDLLIARGYIVNIRTETKLMVSW